MIVSRELTRLYLQHQPFVLVHENSGIGVDAAAHHWYEVAGQELGCFEVKYPPDFEQFGDKARALKGAELVKTGADLVLAFPLFDDEETKHVMDLAKEAGIAVKKVMA